VDRVADRHGVIKGAERIDADIESQVGHFPADVVGKTASQNHDPVLV
jgi:hypothetical protein